MTDDPKKEGMARSEAGANPDWMYLMEKLVVVVAQHYEQFTADHVFALMEECGGPTTHDTRAFGPVMRRAAKAGICQLTDRTVKSTRGSCHYRPLAIWKSLVFLTPTPRSE